MAAITSVRRLSDMAKATSEAADRMRSEETFTVPLRKLLLEAIDSPLQITTRSHAFPLEVAHVVDVKDGDGVIVMKSITPRFKTTMAVACVDLDQEVQVKAGEASVDVKTFTMHDTADGRVIANTTDNGNSTLLFELKRVEIRNAKLSDLKG